MRKGWLTVGLALGLSACATSGSMQPRDAEPAASVSQPVSLVVPNGQGAGPAFGLDCQIQAKTSDPFERFNRAVYRFNARFDEAIFLPVSRNYERFVPKEVRGGIRNFFYNLGEVGNTLNHLLQGRLDRSVLSLSRFALNSTVGLAGLFDPASALGIQPLPTSFGHTLGRWGVGAGPYLVLPLLGPSSLRDTGGLVVDSTVSYSTNVGGLYQSDNAWALGTLNAVDTRANTSFRYYASASPFEYEMVRFLYLHMRMIESGLLLPSDACERELPEG